MSQRITIEIKDKIATCLTELPVVCGNADYVVDFVFDEEWNEHEVKTAIFVVNGKATPQVFAGNVCPIPVIQNTLIVWVGVFAGTVDDGTLSTSTPALVKCIPCITDGDNIPMAPPDDVYNQIIALIEAGMLKGEKGDKGDKGEKGDAGSIKMIPVVELPTENIDYSAIYLVPIEGDDENTFAEYVYIDGKWEVLGSVALNVDHSEYVKFTDYATASKAGVFKVDAEKGFTVGNDGVASLYQASNFDIEQKSNLYKPITPFRLDYAVKVGITTNTETLTDEEKVKALTWLGGDTLSASGYVNSYGKFPMRGAGGRIECGHPLIASHATNKAYVDATFVSKQENTSTMNRIYGEKHSSGGQVMFTLASGGTGDMTIPMRNANGQFDVRTPQTDLNVANKKYVDDLIAELRAMIES